MQDLLIQCRLEFAFLKTQECFICGCNDLANNVILVVKYIPSLYKHKMIEFILFV